MRRWRSAIPALLVFMLVSGSAWVAALALRKSADHSASVALDRRVESAKSAVSADLRRYVDTAADLSMATAAQRDMSAHDFATITSRVRQERLPAAGSLLLVVPAESGGTTIRFSRAVDGPAGVGSGPAGAAEPDRPALAGTELVEALTTSRSTGQLTVSRAIPAPSPVAFAVVAPVYAAGSTANAGQFAGWLVVTVRAGAVLADTLKAITNDGAAATVTDGTDPDHPVVVAAGGRATGTGKLDSKRVEVVVGQRRWQLTVAATAPLVTGTAANADTAAFGAGLLIAGILAGLTWVLATSRERALVQVAQATAAMRADIARRETVEAQLREREAELAGFVAVAAHDLKAPLANVAVYADLLAEIAAEDLDEACLGFLDRIGTGTRRMARLIDDLLAFASAEHGQLRPEQVNLGELVAEVVNERCEPLSATKPDIEVGPLPIVPGDLASLRRLLDNLIGNAMKYVPHGETPQISVAARREPNGWRIEVADRGIGIPAEQRKAVFGAFHRELAAEGYPGTGLGLAICQRIVDRHGGHIGVEGNPGGGSRFWFTLPDAGPPCPGGSGGQPSAELDQAKLDQVEPDQAELDQAELDQSGAGSAGAGVAEDAETPSMERS